MKRLLLWSFDRGSFHYDVMCGLILAFIFLTPPRAFTDRPDYMRVSGQKVVARSDKNGNTILTVKLSTPVFFDGESARADAVKSLEQSLGKPVKPARWQPIYDWADRLIAYAVWIER